MSNNPDNPNICLTTSELAQIRLSMKPRRLPMSEKIAHTRQTAYSSGFNDAVRLFQQLLVEQHTTTEGM